MILAGDIGGTNSRLALMNVRKNKLEILVQQDYPSNQFDDLTPIIQGFLSEHASVVTSIDSACLAVAGPVVEEEAQITNLPWLLRGSDIAHALKIPHCKLVNDFQAVTYGVDQLEEHELTTLQKGDPVKHATRVFLGAGTGLGVSLSLWQGDSYIGLASEGGHSDFAPRTDEQIALLAYWQKQLGRVSYETFLSGAGLVRIYSFLHEMAGGKKRDSLLQEDDPAAAISIAALAGDELCEHALLVFTEIYAAFAGNLALTCLAQGGVYLAGGIAPKIISYLQEPSFCKTFCDKPPMEALLASIPIKVIMNSRAGLLGAAVLGSAYASSS